MSMTLTVGKADVPEDRLARYWGDWADVRLKNGDELAGFLAGVGETQLTLSRTNPISPRSAASRPPATPERVVSVADIQEIRLQGSLDWVVNWQV